MSEMTDMENKKLEFWMQCYLVELKEAIRKDAKLYPGDSTYKQAGRLADLSLKELDARIELFAMEKANEAG